MEAIWKMEDKWKLTTQKATLIFACSAFLAIVLCTVTALRKKIAKTGRIHQINQSGNPILIKSGTNWGSVKKALMGSVRWSGPTRDVRQTPPLLGGKGCESGRFVGWQSHNSVSPVWQRPILMGGKCELPRFSGLILYDERGLPLDQSYKEGKTLGVVRTTLRDLL